MTTELAKAISEHLTDEQLGVAWAWRVPVRIRTIAERAKVRPVTRVVWLGRRPIRVTYYTMKRGV